MRIVTIDCASIRNETEFWDQYVSTTNPEGARSFGRNLDAFWDGIHGGPGWPGICSLRFINTQSIQRFRDGQFYESLREIARDSKLVGIVVE